MKKYVLGVKIDDVTIDQVLETVQGWLSKTGKNYIVTPNPEIVMMAQKDPDLKKILNQADLAIPDGYGLQIGTDIVCNTPGIDVMEVLIKLANDYGYTVGLLGGRDSVAAKAAERLQKKYPKLKVTLASSELNRIPSTDILFVAYGAPKQEKWVDKNLSKIPVKVAMVVGGSFDYLSGQVNRAPSWMRQLRLEWLYRLIQQPWRIKRQLVLLKYLYSVIF